MNPYSGLVDLMEGKELLVKDGNSLKYTLADGTVIKQFRKAWERNEEGTLDKVMVDFAANPHRKSTTVAEEVPAETVSNEPVESINVPEVKPTKKSKKEETVE